MSNIKNMARVIRLLVGEEAPPKADKGRMASFLTYIVNDDTERDKIGICISAMPAQEGYMTVARAVEALCTAFPSHLSMIGRGLFHNAFENYTGEVHTDVIHGSIIGFLEACVWLIPTHNIQDPATEFIAELLALDKNYLDGQPKLPPELAGRLSNLMSKLGDLVVPTTILKRTRLDQSKRASFSKLHSELLLRIHFMLFTRLDSKNQELALHAAYLLPRASIR